MNDFVDSSKAIQGSSEDEESVKLARKRKHKPKYDQEEDEEAETLPTEEPEEKVIEEVLPRKSKKKTPCKESERVFEDNPLSPKQK